MNLNILFIRVLPIVVFSGILLLNFQNCAKPNTLTDTGVNVSSNTGSNGSTNIDDDFPPVVKSPDTGGGIEPPPYDDPPPPIGPPVLIVSENIPQCLKIISAEPIYTAKKADYNDPPLSVTVSLYNSKPTPDGSVRHILVNYSKGKLIFSHEEGNYEYTSQSVGGSLVAAAEFIVPYSVYSKVGRSSVNGFFTGEIFSDLPLSHCNF